MGLDRTPEQTFHYSWLPMLAREDNFQEGSEPADWAVEFEKSVSDVVAHNKCPRLVGASARLTTSRRYRDAHPTDDHFYSLIMVGGAVMEDDVYGEKMARTWELSHMCNNQFVWGSWEAASTSQ